ATRRGWLPWGSLTGRGVTISTRRTRSVILSVQIAVSAVLLVGAALLSRSLHRQITQDLAFVDGVLVGLIESPVRMDAERSRALAAAIEAAALPDMALVLQPPLGGGYRVDDDVALSGAAPEGARSAIVMSASSNFFHVLRLPFASGRSFGGGPSSINEVVVNQSLARQLVPGGGVLGADIVVRRTIRTVVGVVADRHLTGPDDIRPMVFLPYTPGIGPRVLVRDTPQDEAAVLSAIVTGIDPQATIRVQPLGNWVPNAVRGSTIGVVLSSSIAVVALGLSAVGVFGVFWYVVEERRREIGIRLALGAHRANIIRTVFATARWSLLGGLGAGVILSAGGAAMLKGFLHGLSPLDPVSYAIVAVILCVTAAVATYVPARRAAGVDPATTLRSE
ncbi:MAG TPA: FtsX-like permease family protein, partial [Vicinamibacterales bacterium]